MERFMDLKGLLHLIGMKKYLLVLAIGLLTTFCASANRIDQLSTDRQVAKFIISLDSTRLKPDRGSSFSIFSTDEIALRLKPMKIDGVKNWQKVDFNKDGRTDLLVIAWWSGLNPFIAIDLGNEQYKLIRLNYGPGELEPAKVLETKAGPLLLFYTEKRFPGLKPFWGKDSVVRDTLIYKFDRFVNYNPRPKKIKIKSITFKTGGCYGNCPIFTVKVDRSGTANYESNDYYAKLKGRYHTEITASDLKMLYAILNYTDFKRVDDHYNVPWTDDASCELTVNFSDKSTKNISDYGEKGTYSLMAIYSWFFNLKLDEHWKKEY